MMRWHIRRIVDGCAAQQLVARQDLSPMPLVEGCREDAARLPSGSDGRGLGRHGALDPD
ncbi:hypothetical protein THIOKS12580028 [Thiocapsa sp. KS1]|nr:hypothetical protein THIOKS12580028 [Thiocapsa sp. KS1]